jgi:hypothetical protein
MSAEVKTSHQSFPKYFRKEGRCVKVVSQTETRTVILPPDRSVAERYSSAFPDYERLLESLQGLEEVSEEIFRDFLFTFYQSVNQERQKVNEQFMQ